MNQETPFASKRLPIAGSALMSQLVDDKIDLQKRLDAALAENKRLSALCDKWNSECDELREDNKRLAGELDELKKQEPAAWMQSKPYIGVFLPGSEYLVMTDGWKKYLNENPDNAEFVDSHDRPLYLAAGAQPIIAITKDQVRSAGGAVHYDGNVFFKSLEQLNTLLNTGARPDIAI